MLNQLQREAIDEIDGATIVELDTRERTKQYVRSGEHDVERIMMTFRKIVARRKESDAPQEVAESIEEPSVLELSK